MFATNRLILRDFEFTDKDFLFELDNSKVVNKYRTTDIRSMEFCEMQIENWSRYTDELLRVYLIELKDEVVPIGLIFLVDKGEGHIELGYRVQDNYWRKGYCSEAAEKLMSSYFETHDTMVYAETHAANLSSIGLLKKFGFEEYEYIEEYNCRRFSVSKKSYHVSI